MGHDFLKFPSLSESQSVYMKAMIAHGESDKNNEKFLVERYFSSRLSIESGYHNVKMWIGEFT